jgi:acyl dehydratase
MIAAGLNPGEPLPAAVTPVTAKLIVMGAAASRDWQPQHHDRAWAQGGAGLPDIIMNNYTQAGLVSRYVTDWTGPEGRIGRLTLAMKRPVCPGGELMFQGVIEAVLPTVHGHTWVDLAVALSCGEALATAAKVRVALPSTSQSPSPWRCPRTLWTP